ncbi:MAG TPA: hypothetical protein VFT74_01330 [Isosphaeraceae bacterium]|nr:hypothetical protein [Isosphaeraceae bacterium]
MQPPPTGETHPLPGPPLEGEGDGAGLARVALALKARRAGIIESVNGHKGEFVEADAALVRFEG